MSSKSYEKYLNNMASDNNPIVVLLIDDQPMVGEMVRRALLNQANIIFHYCSEANDAIACIENLHPSVILQDLMMPNIDGLTLLKKYREHAMIKDIPVIVLSVKEDPIVKSEAFKLGANDYLIKLPDSIELIARIKYHSNSYVRKLQLDQAFRSLTESQQQLVALNIELQRISNIDGLTGLSNRRLLDEYLLTEWRRATREQTSIAIVMIDVDEFKKYNDTQGHLAGDEVLRKVAGILTQSIDRPSDLAARFGGEEFILVLPNTNSEGAQFVAEKIRTSLEGLKINHQSATSSSYVTISAGVASVIPDKNDTSSSLIALADEALYVAKSEGRNKVCIKQ